MMKLSSLIAIAGCLALAGCNNASKVGASAGDTAGTTGTAVADGQNGKGTSVKQGISTLKSLVVKDTKPGDGMILGIKVGTDKPVENGDLVSLEYTGKLADGTVFDTNKPGTNKHSTPLIFYVGRGSVVPGLEQGVLGMKIGAEREIGIPPSLGYKDQEGTPIPPNSDLHFHIKLLDIVKPGEEGIYDKKDVVVGSGRAAKKGDNVRIEYTGRLEDGTVFDSNVGKAPFEFLIGAIPPAVISGLEDGVVGMKVGGERLLRIPPGIAYQTKNVSGIPPNSTLIFKVKMLGVF
jgi:FKBP-type peptidyl-prolyl cis-trans isomerase